MERLTKSEILAGNKVSFVSDDDCFEVRSVPKKFMGTAIERLAAYEDSGLEPGAVQELVQAKREGRLVVLPCKVGDRVFSGYGNPLDISVSKTNGDCVTHVKISRRGYLFKCWWGCFRISDIGKTVFLTRAEAEAALEAQKGGGGENG